MNLHILSPWEEKLGADLTRRSSQETQAKEHWDDLDSPTVTFKLFLSWADVGGPLQYPLIEIWGEKLELLKGKFGPSVSSCVPTCSCSTCFSHGKWYSHGTLLLQVGGPSTSPVFHVPGFMSWCNHHLDLPHLIWFHRVELICAEVKF